MNSEMWDQEPRFVLNSHRDNYRDLYSSVVFTGVCLWVVAFNRKSHYKDAREIT